MYTVSNAFSKSTKAQNNFFFLFFNFFLEKNEIHTYNQLLSIQIEIRIRFSEAKNCLL
jgi:hypothetical protein